MAWITEAAEVAESGVGTGRWRLIVWSDEDGGGPFGDSTHDHATADEAHDCERCQEFCDRASGFPMRKFERDFTAARVLDQVGKERRRQNEKWGEQNHDPTLYLTILGEQFGEACRAALELRVGKWPESRLRKELLEVAAVAVAAVECLDRRKWAWGSHAVPATAAPPGQGGGEG